MNNIETMNLAVDKALAVMKAAGQQINELKAENASLLQAIEQAQQEEPDYYGLTKDHLWMSITKDHYDRLKPEFRMACYTSPPPRQPLTDEEISDAVREADFDWHYGWTLDDEEPNRFTKFARAIEAAHGIKEKNNG